MLLILSLAQLDRRVPNAQQHREAAGNYRKSENTTKEKWRLHLSDEAVAHFPVCLHTGVRVPAKKRSHAMTYKLRQQRHALVSLENHVQGGECTGDALQVACAEQSDE